MDDNTQMVPTGDLHFEKRNSTLSADLIDRITLFHHVFRNYVPISLEETIDNFKYDEDPESEIRVWEHMASVMLELQYEHHWPVEKLADAAKVVLGMSMGSVQDNPLSDADTQQIAAIWNDRSSR